MTENEKLLPCPFCGKTPKAVERDVEPQEDPWYGNKIERFVLCDCGACLFDQYFHDGFVTHEDAITAWNTRPPVSEEEVARAIFDALCPSERHSAVARAQFARQRRYKEAARAALSAIHQSPNHEG